jgi:hypothetical protein
MTINNGYARLHDPILPLKVAMGTPKNFSGKYRQFGHAISKMFAISGLVS